jgi:ABC-2 type transport system permease protein
VTTGEFDVAAMGPPITGPSALGASPRRFLHLAMTLAITDFKLRFFGSMLGYFWQLMRPLLLFGVLYFVFTKFVKVGGVVAHYPVVLLMNIVLFTFFAEATGGAVSSLVDREGLVRKIQFPRMAVPSSVVITASFNLGLNLLVVLIFALSNGVRPRVTWLELPVLIVLLQIFALGVGTLLSAAFVRYRDVRPIWEVTMQALFYATPVIYAVETLGKGETVEHLMMLNPLAVVIQQVRYAVIDPGAPSAAAVAGGIPMLLIPALGALLISVVGLLYFRRQAPRIAEDL